MSEKLPATWEAMLLEWLAQGMPGPGFENWAKEHLANASLKKPPPTKVRLSDREYDVSNPRTFHELFDRAATAALENEDVGNRLAVMASNVQRAHLAYRAALLVYKARAYGYRDADLREGFRQLVMLSLRGTQFLLRHLGGPNWDRELIEVEDDPQT
ncbi:hypothetical protein Ocepr_2374 (plasmid) [Oceanithermus profundus DSM 14977]|uniref:Uncharacterized protein n=1 Tax=Oceanithermus profundus (strain DSM 14977 / NBRC 100410 / VKM B-2274 / 506) TaxID=670487 RepID=E4UAP3_OCEP5|nr:hypothetical protein [Oceanithermus profundus]ADR37822.1 hypothetical protein Ocepr_2374 [Oceanithermus profundus DSM 14977]